MVALPYGLSGLLLVVAAIAFALDALSAWTQILAGMTMFFFRVSRRKLGLFDPQRDLLWGLVRWHRYVLWCRHSIRRRHSASFVQLFYSQTFKLLLAVGYIVRQVDVDCGFYRSDF